MSQRGNNLQSKQTKNKKQTNYSNRETKKLPANEEQTRKQKKTGKQRLDASLLYVSMQTSELTGNQAIVCMEAEQAKKSTSSKKQ